MNEAAVEKQVKRVAKEAQVLKEFCNVNSELVSLEPVSPQVRHDGREVQFQQRLQAN